MGKMAEYVNNKQIEVQASNGLIVNYRKLWEIRESLTSEIKLMSDALKGLHSDLVNVDDMIFEIQEKLESRGIKV